MNSTAALAPEQVSREPGREFSALRRSFRLSAAAPERAKALKDAARRQESLTSFGEVLDPVLPDSAPHAALERATKTFRFLRARESRATAARARLVLGQLKDLYARWVSVGVSDFDALTKQTRELESRAKWHEQRAGAQLPRFATIRACRTKTLHVSCRACDTSLCEPVPCSCGVVRVCEQCAESVAAKRQKRIAAARVEAMAGGADAGLFDGRRFGGAFSEKMLTLTVPHVTRAECRAVVRDGEDVGVLGATEGFGLTNTVAVRLAALRLAWPLFIRRVRAWLSGKGRRGQRRRGDPRDVRHFAYYRLQEWTRGHDGKGHPHYHVYLFSPWLPCESRAEDGSDNLMRRWWASSLEAVGVPLPTSCGDCIAGRACSAGGAGKPHVMIDLTRLDGFNWSALKELVKAGDRKAIEAKLGTMKTPGDDAITYALAWTMGDAFEDQGVLPLPAVVDVQRDLFCALEGRRLAQGSRGFLCPMPEPRCECCGSATFVAAVDCGIVVDAPSSARKERGPPDGCEEEEYEGEDESWREGLAWS